MKTMTLLAGASFTLAFAAAAQASSSDRCGNVPAAQWMSESALTQKAEALGYKVRRIKIEDGCYEVYGVNPSGQRVEAYFHPATGEVVRTKVDD